MRLFKFLKQLLLASQTADNLLARLDAIETKLETIEKKWSKIMATVKEFDDLLKAIDDETTRIAAKIQELLDGMDGGGLNSEEEAALAGKLGELRDRLTTIGTDPVNPIPPVGPVNT